MRRGQALSLLVRSVLPRVAASAKLPSDTETQEYGVSSFTYRSKRPMNAMRFKAFTDALCARALGDTAAQVLRAKGFVWLAGQPKTQGVFAFAGRAAELTPGGTWWAAMEREEWPPGVAQVR